jgi:C4-dicarboxylate transporter, DctM subunit
MTPMTTGFVGILILLVLIALKMPIGFSMGVVGFAGFVYLSSFQGALAILGSDPFGTVSSYSFSVLPLFILMGNLAFASGISNKLFNTGQKWLGHLPGGLASATIAGCAGFAAISGSSAATAATMGAVSLDEMKKYNYDPALSTGAVAAGGTLGILIPPSNLFIIYGILTQESIGKLFIAGIIPGIILAAMYIATISIQVIANPKLGPRAPNAPFREKIASLVGATDMVILFFLVMGGLYGGLFTPNEAAGIGAAGSLLIGLVRRKISLKAFNKALIDTIKVTAMIFIILIGAIIFNKFLVLTGIPAGLASFISGLSMSPNVTLFFMFMLYLILGCFFDTAAITLLTIPIFFPLVVALRIDPIWFGVFFCICMEMGMLTPPVGMNCYVISGTSGVPLHIVFKGVIPLLIPMTLMIVLLVIFPKLALYLPNLMKG